MANRLTARLVIDFLLDFHLAVCSFTNLTVTSTQETDVGQLHSFTVAIYLPDGWLKVCDDSRRIC